MAQLLLQSTLEFTALFILLYSYISTSSKLHDVHNVGQIHLTCFKISIVTVILRFMPLYV